VSERIRKRRRTAICQPRDNVVVALPIVTLSDLMQISPNRLRRLAQ